MATRLFPRIGLGVAGLLLAALAISANVALQKINDDDSETALAFMPWGAAANADTAEDALRARQFAEAERLSIRSLDRTLLNVKALRTLALAREARDPKDSFVGPGMVLAGQLGWRDTPTQFWLMLAGLRAANYPVAMQRADALLRRDQATEEVLAILRQVAADPDALHAIIDTLVTQPNWRQALFQAKATTPAEANGMETIVAALQKTAAPPSRHELWFYLDALMRARDYDRAYRVWQASAHAGVGSPQDPSFAKAAVLAAQTVDQAADQMPFEWNFRTEQAVAPHFGPQGSIQLSGSYERIADFIYQTVHLAPGAHRLTVDVVARKDQLDILQWKLTCLPGRKQILQDPIILPAAGGTQLAYDFVIPPQGCAYQRLGLTLSPPVESGDITMTINKVAITG